MGSVGLTGGCGKVFEIRLTAISKRKILIKATLLFVPYMRADNTNYLHTSTLMAVFLDFLFSTNCSTGYTIKKLMHSTPYNLQEPQICRNISIHIFKDGVSFARIRRASPEW
jgi:hypothetical protein